MGNYLIFLNLEGICFKACFKVYVFVNGNGVFLGDYYIDGRIFGLFFYYYFLWKLFYQV